MATGGMDWAEALLARQSDVLAVDLFLLIAGTCLLRWRSASARHRRGEGSLVPGVGRVILAATVAGTAVSLAALGHLAATDPKRRRAFRLPPAPGGRPGLAWAAVLLPGGAVASLAGGGGFLVWFGAVTVAGWAIAARRPQRAERAGHALAAAGARLRRAGAAFGRRLEAVAGRIAALHPAPGLRTPRRDRIALLEAQVAALEAELAALRDGPVEAEIGAVVVEFQRPARR